MDVQENGRLSLVRPGTPCGELMRRYWFPIEIAKELRDLPKLVRFLGEDLVLFRDGRGRPGLLGKHCSHRGTSLEYGQIDEEGIRCCYHAWLYDVEGRVLDTPAEHPESSFKHTIRHLAYPCRELGGWIFTYMGPPEKMPELPGYDFLVREDGTRVHWTVAENCNWLQNVENHADPTHTALLHEIPGKRRFQDYQLDIPDLEVERTVDGICTTSVRSAWRTRVRMILPNLALHAETNPDMFGPEGAVLPDAQSGRAQFEPYTRAYWTVPIDDTHHIDFRMQFIPHRDGKPRFDYTVSNQRETPESYEEAQREPVDTEAQEGQGLITRREEWHLASSDKAVIVFDDVLDGAISAVERGQDPPGIVRDPAKARFISTRGLIGTTYETNAIEPWRLDIKVWNKRIGAVVD